MERETYRRIRSSLSEVAALKKKLDRNADLDLILQRVDQVEEMLSALAESAGAGDGMERSAAGVRISRCRRALHDSLG